MSTVESLEGDLLRLYSRLSSPLSESRDHVRSWLRNEISRREELRSEELRLLDMPSVSHEAQEHYQKRLKENEEAIAYFEDLLKFLEFRVG